MRLKRLIALSLCLKLLTTSSHALGESDVYLSPHIQGSAEFDIAQIKKGQASPFTGVLMDEKSFRTLADRSDQLDTCEIRLENQPCGDQWTFESVKAVEKVGWVGFGALLTAFLFAVSK